MALSALKRLPRSRKWRWAEIGQLAGTTIRPIRVLYENDLLQVPPPCAHGATLPAGANCEIHPTRHSQGQPPLGKDADIAWLSFRHR